MKNLYCFCYKDAQTTRISLLGFTTLLAIALLSCSCAKQDESAPAPPEASAPSSKPPVSAAAGLKIDLVDNSKSQYQDGVGCSYWPTDKEPKADDPKSQQFILIGNEKNEAWINVDGKVVALKLVKDTVKMQGKKGDPFTQTYQAEDLTVEIEGTAESFGDVHAMNGDATITVTKGAQKQVLKAKVSCGA